MPSERLGPPRPLAVGDVVATRSRFLGAWTVAQVTALHVGEKQVAVLELDWSGPEPMDVTDIGDPQPLVLTHHAWDGGSVHAWREWVLPRSYRVIGSLPLREHTETSSYTGWNVGLQLAQQRRWDAGDHGDWSDMDAAEFRADALARLLAEDATTREDLTSLRVYGVEDLDCDELVSVFPRLESMALFGELGRLRNSEAINGLADLAALRIVGLFGMAELDVPLPSRLPLLESLALSDVPVEYAHACRRVWRPEIPRGVSLEIRGARTPEWVAENRDNPFREWPERPHITGAGARRVVGHYRSARREVATLFDSGNPPADVAGRLIDVGRRFAEAMNALDTRRPFIFTQEREELADALDNIVTQLETTHGRSWPAAREALEAGVDSARDW